MNIQTETTNVAMASVSYFYFHKVFEENVTEIFSCHPWSKFAFVFNKLKCFVLSLVGLGQIAQVGNFTDYFTSTTDSFLKYLQSKLSREVQESDFWKSYEYRNNLYFNSDCILKTVSGRGHFDWTTSEFF